MDLILLWHFHQPYYGLPGKEELELPWVRLHGAKSYLDMAAILQQHPEIRVTANFSGSLIEQLERYTRDGWRDRAWHLTLRRPSELTEQEYRFLLRHFFSFDWRTGMRRFPRLPQLLEARGRSADPASWSRLSRSELVDLQVLFNLVWCGFTLRHEDRRIRALIDKGRDYTQEDKELVLAAHSDAVRRVLPTWRTLVDAGQVELSVSPHYHPILPLLIDSDSARRALPDHPMPARFQYPQDAVRQLELALATARDTFGRRPVGLWPSEGSVSPELLPVAADLGMAWLASDEQVLSESLLEGPTERARIYQPWSAGPAPLGLFFRDHRLSDLVGFSYAHTESHLAASDFCARLQHIRDDDEVPKHPCVSVILDGENAWEHYPDDGRRFLDLLYRGLAKLDGVRTTTPSVRLAERPPRKRIAKLHSGSWISANFRIWIGVPEKNLAWDQLQQARGFYEDRLGQAGAADSDRLEQAYTCLLRAEGSDWMWWYGDDFFSADDLVFDLLFREHLKAVYQGLGAPPPVVLENPIVGREIEPAVRQPRNLIHPTIDGRGGRFLDWVEAGTYTPGASASPVARAARYLTTLYFGFDLATLFLRIDTSPAVWPNAEHPFQFHLDLVAPTLASRVEIDLPLNRFGSLEATISGHEDPATDPVRAAYFLDCLELALSFEGLRLESGAPLELALSLVRDGVPVQRVPQRDMLEIHVPDATFEGRNWLV